MLAVEEVSILVELDRLTVHHPLACLHRGCVLVDHGVRLGAIALHRLQPFFCDARTDDLDFALENLCRICHLTLLFG